MGLNWAIVGTPYWLGAHRVNAACGNRRLLCLVSCNRELEYLDGPFNRLACVYSRGEVVWMIPLNPPAGELELGGSCCRE